jgi:hypothetical protein
LSSNWSVGTPHDDSIENATRLLRITFRKMGMAMGKTTTVLNEMIKTFTKFSEASGSSLNQIADMYNVNIEDVEWSVGTPSDSRRRRHEVKKAMYSLLYGNDSDSSVNK